MRENIQNEYICTADIIPNWDDMRTIVDIPKLCEIADRKRDIK